MILATGRGERMRPLTDHCPKPLLNVNDKPLIVYHIEKLVAGGIVDIVINHAWLGDKIIQALGDGSQFGASIAYSDEQAGAYETAGGIVKALPMLTRDANGQLSDEPFLVVNGDIFTDFDFSLLSQVDLNQQLMAHLVLVDNPAHNPSGDFAIDQQGKLTALTTNCFTFSGIGLYHPHGFAQLPSGRAALGPLIRRWIANEQVSAQHFAGRWTDVGTPERLAQINDEFE